MSEPRRMPPRSTRGPEQLERRGAECLEYVKARATQGDPQSVLKFFDEFAYANWMMNVGDVKGPIVDAEITKSKPQVMVEIGGFCGYSAVRFASKLREVSGPSAHYYSFEYSPVFAGIATEMIKLAGLEDAVTITVGAFESTYTKLRETLGVNHIDALFIDHHKDLYLSDLKLVETAGLLRPGSVVIADNVVIPGAPGYLEYVRSHPRFTSVFHESLLEYTDEKDGVEISVYA